MANATYTVDPGGSKTYLSIQACFTAVMAGHTSGDTVTIECYRTTSAKDTTPVSLSGIESGETLIITAHPDHRHEGKYADQQAGGNYIYTLEVSTADGSASIYNFSYAEDVTVEGLIVSDTATIAGTKAIYHVRNTDKCIVLSDNNAIEPPNNGVVQNSFVRATGGRAIFSASGVTNVSINNSTVFGGYAGIEGTTDCTVTNCYVSGTTTAFNGTFNAASDYNVSSDATASVFTNNAQSQATYASYFVDYANDDYRLLADSNTLWGLSGTDLSATFTDDIEGETRSVWDIGADEYATAASGPTIPIFINHYRNMD